MDDYQHHRLTQALGHADGATPITVNAGDLRAALEAAVRVAELETDLEAIERLEDRVSDLEDTVQELREEMKCLT